MKKIFIFPLVILFISGSALNAQLAKGALFLGGNFSINTQNVTGTYNAAYKQNNYSVSPVFGKLIRENLVLGIDAGISIYKQEQNDATSTSKQSGYSGGIFVRQYKPIGKSFYLFLQERLGYRYDKYVQKYSAGSGNTGSDYKRNTIVLNVNPGISYAVNKRLHLEAGFNNLLYLSYAHEKGNNFNGTTTGFYSSNNFNAGGDLTGFNSLYIGFRIFLVK